MKTLGENIRFLRKKKKLSQEELGKELGRSESAVQMWESNLRTPSLLLLKELAKALDIDEFSLVYTDVEKTFIKYQEHLETETEENEWKASQEYIDNLGKLYEESLKDEEEFRIELEKIKDKYPITNEQEFLRAFKALSNFEKKSIIENIWLRLYEKYKYSEQGLLDTLKNTRND